MRDSRAHAFAQGGVLATAAPCAALGIVLDEISGPGRTCPATTADELMGLLGRWDAQESWVAGAKLGVLRALIRRHPAPAAGVRPGGLPQAWAPELASQVTLELGISGRAADALLDLAWTLEARLPLTAAALEGGILTLTKTRIIAEITSVLSDEQAAQAEALIAARWAGKTPSQIAAMIGRAVVSVDPDGARRRREEAERDKARVQFWREHCGTAAIAAFGLPTDRALEANQNIQNRALAYKKAGITRGMDQLRVLAYLDLLTEKDSRDDLAAWTATGGETSGRSGGAGGDQPGSPLTDQGGGACGAQPGSPHTDQGGGAGGDQPGCADSGQTSDTGGRAGGTGEDSRAAGTSVEGSGGDIPGGGPGTGCTGGTPGDGSAGNDGVPGNHGRPEAKVPGSGTGAGLAANVNLTIPLATLLGLAERPGEAHGLGAIDPALARGLAASAARSDRSAFCVTVTDKYGHAIGHGCARMARSSRTERNKPGGGGGNRDGPSFTRHTGHGPPGGYGTWTLTLEGGRTLTVKLAAIPVTDCDHRLESKGHDPSPTLRHLVEIRDGACDFPPCVRPARRCDFEHAIPYHQGGRTCACNGGPRCRHDHQVKQSTGWAVRQPLPGYHEWVTPAGRVYSTEPMRYPI
ncbi:MAG: DUF222 domain-containing protein [Streptosporangiaceae bacterium]|nr:DUF222 domain-containing protein [Streptosporangiaceae bacterium]MBV9855230.1 DUF222 domain-containing protein [Streptosporangiaceae bacterium]